MSVKCPKCQADNPETATFCSDCGTKIFSPKGIDVTETLETPKEELTTGSTFAGRYQIIEELGKGGMGRVYRVLDKELKEEVALKLIKPEIAKDKNTIERFKNELKTARKISHRNVGRMYELMEDRGTHFITMEYVSGQDLRGLIRQTGQLTIGKAIAIAAEICEGLSEAHRQGVIHRDLKPSNIIIDKDGNARILDFGIARSVEGKSITGAGVIIGTPEYMSPEQVEGKDTDHRSDLYSLGVILYEMVTGRVPFEGDTPFTVGVKHKSEVPQNPKEINSQIPDDLNNVILKCLEKEKEKRYQSAGEVRSELTRAEKRIPTAKRTVPEKKPITSKEITVKFNIKRIFIPAFVAIAVVIAVVIIWNPWAREESSPISSGKPSIAVLPFDDVSPEKDQEHLCDGFADELISRLTKIERLKVPARTSSFSFKGKGLSAQEIGEILEVENILEGSIRKADNKLRITVQLVKTADGYPIWSELYERDDTDIFELQDDISLKIIDKLKLKLLKEESEDIVKRHTENLEAYRWFLQGLSYWNKRGGENVKKAVDCFEKATEADPNYALAYARLSDSYGLLPFYTAIMPKDAFSKAEEAVMKALEIDDMLPEAHSALGLIRTWYDWDWQAAESELKRAVQGKPSYVTAHQWYAEFLSAMGRHEEAIIEIERALEIDPLSLLINVMKGNMFYLARQYDKAIEQCQETLALDPNYPLAHNILALSYLQKKMYKEALNECKKGVEFRGGELRASQGYAYALAGMRAEALRELEEMKELWKRGDIRARSIAIVYTGLGEKDQAIEWLEKSYLERDPQMVRLNVDPIFDSLRANPRYKALSKKMNFD